MNTYAYQCPCCASPLQYDGASHKLMCASCGNSYDAEALEMMQTAQPASSIQFAMPEQSLTEKDAAEMQAFTCKNCGAELMTDETTTATECPYCGSSTILPNRLESGVRPEKVIPFTVTKEQAQQAFDGYFKGKRLLPNIFLRTHNRIAEMRKLYVPYWLFDCDAHGSIVYHAEKWQTERRGEWEIAHIKHYIVRREGRMRFEGIPVDGSEKLDNRITESLEPYDMSAAVPFRSAVLAGAMADHADVDAHACEARAVERVETSIADALRGTVSGYTSVTERSRSGGRQGHAGADARLADHHGKRGQNVYLRHQWADRQADLRRACRQKEIPCMGRRRICGRPRAERIGHGAVGSAGQRHASDGGHFRGHCCADRCRTAAGAAQAGVAAERRIRLCPGWLLRAGQ